MIDNESREIRTKIKKTIYLNPEELLSHAFHNVDRVSIPYRKGENYAYRKKLSKKNAFENTVTSKIDRFVKNIPSLEKLEPFQADIIEIEIGMENLKAALASLSWTSKKISEIGKALLKKEGINFKLSTFFGRTKSILMEESENFKTVNKATFLLAGLPAIDKTQPTVVVAGYPNVGKSMLIGFVSTLKPTIAAYPFTTQKVEMGHIIYKNKTIQILDTPGMLERISHNKMEKSTISAIKSLADLILFMIDPTGQCGWTTEEQEALLKKIKTLQPSTPIIEVETKSDILKRDNLRLKISSLTGDGIDLLLNNILKMC